MLKKIVSILLTLVFFVESHISPVEGGSKVSLTEVEISYNLQPSLSLPSLDFKKKFLVMNLCHAIQRNLSLRNKEDLEALVSNIEKMSSSVHDLEVSVRKHDNGIAEVTVQVPGENIAIRYLDREHARLVTDIDGVVGLETSVFGDIHRQVIHTAPDSARKTRKQHRKKKADIKVKPVFRENSPLLFNDDWKKSIESSDLEEIHIITAGGGGDVVGGTFLALQLKHMIGRNIKIKVFTSNLKRGEENPAGGPLVMTTPEGGKRFPSFHGSEHFYPIDKGLKITTVIKDANQREIDDPRYRATIPLSEGKIIDVLARKGIELVMSDAGQSGKALADDYLRWQGERSDKLFVIGLDMGGDIFARFPYPIDKKNPDTHPEKDIRSPNTDAVFLDMFSELGESPEFKDRLLLGVSALGGDGELGETLKGYIQDLYESGDIEGVLDNMRYMAENDPQGLVTRKVVEECLSSIPTEVSGNFLMRIFSISRVLPLVGEKLRKETGEKTEGWANEFSARGYSRGMPLEDIFDPETIAEELPAGKLSRSTIRNKTRTEVLPLAYPLTIFMRPGAVTGRIADPEMRDTTKTWMEKDRYLREKLSYHTEMSDPNNISDRELINEYLLKTRILADAWAEEDPAKRPEAINSQLRSLKERNYVLSPNMEADLKALCDILYEDFDDTLSHIAYQFSGSEAEYQRNKKILVDWVNENREKVKTGKHISLYTYSYFVAYVLTDLANFVTDASDNPSMDKFMSLVGSSFGTIERIEKVSRSDVLCSIIVERVIPVIARSSASEETFSIKMNALETFVKNKMPGGLRTFGCFHFVFFVIPYVMEYEFEERHRTDLDEILSAFGRFAQTLESINTRDAGLKYIPFYKAFQDILPETLRMFNSHKEIKVLLDILRIAAIKEAVEGRMFPSHLYTLLDMLSQGMRARQITTLEEIRGFLEEASGFIKKCEKKGLEVSSVLLGMMRIAEKLDDSAQFVELIDIFSEKIDIVVEFDTSYTEHGTTHDLPDMVRKQIEEKKKRYSGRALLEAIKNIDFNQPVNSTVNAEMMSDFELIEKDIFAKESQTLKRSGIETDEQLGIYIRKKNHLRGVRRLTPVEVFDRDEKVIHQVLEADNPDERALAIREKEEEYKQRGETLIRDSNFAFGFTSGLLTRRPADHMDINLTLQIEGTDGRDRRFVEWKFYMLKKMQELYRTSKIPVVIMSGFRTNNLSEQLLRTDNFGYSGPVYLYYQGPTKVMDKKGTPVTVNGEELFATPGAWGYIKWLVISSKLRQLRKDKIRYISHSNVNNPVESVDAATLGYFDHMAEEARKNGREEPLALVQLGQRMRRVGPDGRELWERGGAAVEIEYADGSQERRVVHQDRWPEDSDFLSSTNDNYNLANYIINLDRLWEIFGLEDLEALYDGDKAGETDFKKILAERVAEVEREKKISPILRVRDIMGGDKGVFIDYALDDLTLLGDWLACHVDRKDHFVSLKGFGDLFQYSNAHVMSRKMKQVELDIYRSNNPLVDYLQAKNVIHDLSNTTVEEIRRKILRMFLPSRLFRESEDLVEGIYVPGAYILKEVEKDNEEEANNVAFRDKIADQELGLLAEQFRERLPELDAMRREAKRLWRYVFDLDLDNGVKLRDGITNAESNMIVRQCVKIVFFGTPYTADFNPFASVNRTLNDMALRRLKAKGDGMTIPEILKESVSSVKFKQYSSINQINNENFEAAYGEIEKEIEKANNGNDFSDADNVDLLLSRMLSGQRRVTYITDDNGEIVYHLYLIQRFLERNPELKVTVIPRGGQYGVDASYEDITQVIQSEELFEPIRKMMELPDSRITIVKTSPRLGGIDVRRLSPLARDSIAESDFVISVGCMNYEMLSGIKKESFHILMTHGKTSIRATGRPEGTYNVIHQMPGIQYFKHDENLIKRMVYDTVAESGSSQRGEKVFGRDEELSRERKEKEKAEDDLERDHGMPGERNIDDGPEGDDQDAPDGSPLSGKEKEDPTNVPQKALSEAAEGFLAYLADVETKIAGMIREPVLIRIPIEAMEIVQDKDVLRTFFRAVTEGRDSDLYFEVFSASGYKVIGEDEYARFGIKQRTLPESLKERNRTNTLTLLMGDPNEGGLPLRTDDIGIRIGDIDIGIGDSLLSPLVLKDDQTGIVRSIMFGLQLTVFSRQIAADPSLARKQSFKDRLQAEVLETFKRTFNVAEKDNVDITPDDLIGLMTGSINDIRRAIVKLIRLIPIEPFEAEELRKIYERTAEILKAA